jgi:hypothetical protein
MCIPFDREATMRRRAKLVFGAAATFAALATGLAILAQEAAPRDVERSESALYTRPYKVEENGVVRMSPDCKCRILPRYLGYLGGAAGGGQRIVDERTTLVLQDTKNHFWAVVSELSRADAERLHRELGEVLAAKRDGK